jgi:CO dehydrogenase maturation factor
MKIAVAGKGGVGKTTIAGTLARALARDGCAVVAIDADVNPMLGISLGLGVDRCEQLAGVRQALAPLGRDALKETTVDALLDGYGADAPDGVRVLVAARTDMPDHGCLCCGARADRLLAAIDDGARAVIGDLEAGVGMLANMEGGTLDLVMVVANPAPKSIEVARRAAEVAAAREMRVLVIANRVGTGAELEAIRATLGEHSIAVVPDDPAIAAADARGAAPIDHDPSSPAVRAIVEIARRVVLNGGGGPGDAGVGAGAPPALRAAGAPLALRAS